MALNDKQRQIGMDNFRDAVRITRRQMLSGVAAIPTAASLYWGYSKLKGDPIKVGIIGTGNQGVQAHISQHNPDYIQFVAFSDIRPSNQERAWEAFGQRYGKAATDIKLYEDYNDLLDDPNVEMVIIALPLHLHAEATIKALRKGKHVLCEKLMAKTVTECKEMVREADKAGKFLAIGHQRHYSYLYANARQIIEQGLLGDIRHIDAWWHRNFSVQDGWRPAIPESDKNIDAKKYGYDSVKDLVQWRVDSRTGGGLMVELGSHQLDAASIFLGHKLPVAVVGTGMISYLDDGRDTFDHVFLNYEFGEDEHTNGDEPPKYSTDKAVVTYSSISTNQFDKYGEQINGTKATMLVQSEAAAYLFKEAYFGEFIPKDTRITWADAVLGEPSADSGSTAAWGSGGGTQDTLTSRGYREEQEHLAWLIREYGKPSPEHRPRCDGRVGLTDAAIALVSNMAMEKKKRIEFKADWFDPASDSAPENEV